MSFNSDVIDSVSAGVAELGKTLLTDHLTEWARRTPDRVAITFMDYTTERDGVAHELTYAQLDRNVTIAASHLRQHVEPGDRVAILAPQSLQYVEYFLGALRAGVVAVPLFSPDLPGHSDRLASIFGDCTPAAVLAAGSNHDIVVQFLDEQNSPDTPILRLDGPKIEMPLPGHDVALSDLAYLQYTSGSTRMPAGVLISQANVVANAAQAILALHNMEEEAHPVSWLPLFHDMGLVFVVGAVCVGGLHTTLMDPISFLVQPLRWLQALSRGVNTISPAPNFAFDYCSSKITAEEKATLDLSGVKSLANGAEPVRPETLAKFNAAFAECGIRPNVIRPSYGLAEATVYVAGSSSDTPAVEAVFDFGKLAAGLASTEIGPENNTIRMVSVGQPQGQQVVVANPDNFEHVEDGVIGELWVHGPNVSAGYWNKPELTDEVFGQTLKNPRGVPADSWLRTGDLGAYVDGELYITGRMKDLIIIAGRNHYPQDIELTVENAHSVIGRHRSAAFSVPSADGEALVVVAEVSRHARDEDWTHDEVKRAVRTALSQRHSVAVLDVVMVVPNDVPRTSSGKIARAATRQRYLDGQLVAAGTQS